MSSVEMTLSASESLRWGKWSVSGLRKKSLFVSNQTFFDAEEVYLASLKKSDLVKWLSMATGHEQVLHVCSTVSNLEKAHKGLKVGFYVYFKARNMCRKYYKEFILSQSSEQLSAIIEPPTTLFKLGELLDKRQSKLWLKIARASQEINTLVEIHERTSCERVKRIAYNKLSKVI